MWKKDDPPTETFTREPERAARPERAAPPPLSAERATIGRSITIRGDVTGDEDLLIQGCVEGSVDLKQHSVTVGADGEVEASIVGRIVTIEGRVQGDIRAEEQVILRNAAFVQGDITAPRVVLEDGARFRGLVDMGDVDERARKTGDSASAKQKKSAEPVEPRAESAAAASEGTSTLIGARHGPSQETATPIRA
jgi:cytoskeletal protein CcmA (bactofilin family)